MTGGDGVERRRIGLDIALHGGSWRWGGGAGGDDVKDFPRPEIKWRQ